MSVIVAVMAWHAPMNYHLQRWLADNKLEWFRGSQEFGVDICRNQAVEKFLQEYNHEYLLMVDIDMYPLPETNEILEAQGDCFWCPYACQQGSHEASFGCSFSKYSRDLLETMERPYFHLPRKDDVSNIDRSEYGWECQYFSNKLPVPARPIGRVGHLKTVVILPQGDIQWP